MNRFQALDFRCQIAEVNPLAGCLLEGGSGSKYCEFSTGAIFHLFNLYSAPVSLVTAPTDCRLCAPVFTSLANGCRLNFSVLAATAANHPKFASILD